MVTKHPKETKSTKNNDAVENNVKEDMKSSYRKAIGSLVTVDRALFFTVVEYMAKNDLVERFSEFLAEKGHGEIILDVATANFLKSFFAEAKLKDTKARMIIQCSCGGGGGGGGGGTAGVRG